MRIEAEPTKGGKEEKVLESEFADNMEVVYKALSKLKEHLNALQSRVEDIEKALENCAPKEVRD